MRRQRTDALPAGRQNLRGPGDGEEHPYRIDETDPAAGTARADAALRITAPNTALVVGDSVQLTVSFIANGQTTDVTGDATLHFSTSNPSVLTVSPTGMVRAVGVGRATARVQSDDIG